VNTGVYPAPEHTVPMNEDVFSEFLKHVND
jgi:hypothetical protein